MLEFLSSLQKESFNKVYIKERSLLSKIYTVIYKGLCLVLFKALYINLSGIKIGISEKELVLSNALYTKTVPGVYGLFTLLIDLPNKRVSIKDAEFASHSFETFQLTLLSERNRTGARYLLWTILLGVFAGIFFFRFDASKKAWIGYFQKKDSGKKESKRQVFYQNRILCKECKLVPANIMFYECRHLVYCDSCFRVLKCTGRKVDRCFDCRDKFQSFVKINYI